MVQLPCSDYAAVNKHFKPSYNTSCLYCGHSKLAHQKAKEYDNQAPNPSDDSLRLVPRYGPVPQGFSLRARALICSKIGHSRISLQQDSQTMRWVCGRCCQSMSQNQPQHINWRDLVSVHHDGKLCSFCLQAFPRLRWHDWLWLRPGLAESTRAAFERTIAEAQDER